MKANRHKSEQGFGRQCHNCHVITVFANDRDDPLGWLLDIRIQLPEGGSISRHSTISAATSEEAVAFGIRVGRDLIDGLVL
ncbi:MAG TPA: hypothetical protein VIT90_15195 [Lysobacter sp.]